MRRLTAALGIVCVCVLALALNSGATATANPACPIQTFTYKHAVLSFNEHGDITRVQVEIADTALAQEYGLMCRTSLSPNSGMLFSFSDMQQSPFWMKNTLIPLSIAFMDAHWHIVALLDMPVEPDPLNGPFALYTSNAPYRYALEVNEGFFVQHGIDTTALVGFLPLGSVGH
jgi:uncharacterized membrane protein (UPF0127 family)